MSAKFYCRYLRLDEEQCTAEAVDPEAEILLCEMHLARAFRIVQERLAERGLTTAPEQLRRLSGRQKA